MAKQSLVSVYFKINVIECEYVKYSAMGFFMYCFFLFLSLVLSLNSTVSKDTFSSTYDYSSFSLPKPFVTQKATPVKKDLPKEKPS